MLPQMDSLEEVASQQNYYAKHLAEVNKTCDVIATQDIYNENGLLVTRKGARINHHTAELIIQHKLLQPLEEQVKLEKSLNREGLNKGIKSLMDKYPDVKQIHYAYEFQKTIERLIESSSIHSIFLQELTVMNECLPKHYEKTLFCTWLSMLIGAELGIEKDLIENVFLAGLTRDVGLLHIPPGIHSEHIMLSPEEWRAIQSHVVTGYLMLNKLYDTNSPAANAVLEHHERSDGSGYPVGKSDDQLGILGQIIAMADSIQAIRINNFAKCGRNLMDVLPSLKMRRYSHFTEIYNAVSSILKKSDLQPSYINPYGDTKTLLSHLLLNGKNLQNAVMLLKEAIEHIRTNGLGSPGKKILKAASPVALMINASGLEKDEIFNWLETMQVNPDGKDMYILLEMEIMQNELTWQLSNVCRVIDECLNRHSGDIAFEHKEYLGSTSGRISGILAH